MTQINIDLATPLVVTWLELQAAFASLHMGERAEIERLHDVYVNSMPAPSYTVALPGQSFDERKPRPGDNFQYVINPLALSKWIREVSSKRGFPYSERQALNIALGIEDYGF